MDITVDRDVLSKVLNCIEAAVPSNPLAHWLTAVEGEMDADDVVTLCATVTPWADPGTWPPSNLRRIK